MIKKEIEEYQKNRCVIVAGLALLLFMQLIVTVIFNLTQLPSHMGYDSSWSFLKAMLIWKEKSLVSDIWEDTTATLLDGSIVPASVLYGLTGNIYLSYGICNSLFVILLLLVMLDVARNFGFDQKGRLVCLNMLLCPFLLNGTAPNNLGYFSVLLCGDCLYNVRTLTFLVALDALLLVKDRGTYEKEKTSENNNKKFNILAAVTFFLSFVSGMSAGIYLLTVCFMPLVFYAFLTAIAQNNAKLLYSRRMLFPITGGVCVVLGKIFQFFFIPLSTGGDEKTWTTITDFWKNTGAVFQGFMKLLNVLPVTRKIEILSVGGILKFLSLGLAFLIMAALLWCIYDGIKRLKNKEFDSLLFIPASVILGNIVVFSLFNVQYGSPIFEERYLICAFVSMMLLTGYCISSIDKSLLFTKILTAGLLLALLFTDVASDSSFLLITNKDWHMDSVADKAEELDAGIVLFCGDDLLETGRAMRVYDYGRIYKCVNSDGNIVHWGDYTFYDDLSFYEGRIMYVVSRENSDLTSGILDGAVYNGACMQYDIYTAGD